MTKIPKSGWVPAGQDPTELDFPMERPTVAGCGWKIAQVFIVLFAFYGIVVMYQQTQRPAAPPSSPTIPPNVLIIFTPSPRPPLPTQRVIVVTATAAPEFISRTNTPSATNTPIATPTATATPPGALTTWTPGAWMLTRWSATLDAQTTKESP